MSGETICNKIMDSVLRQLHFCIILLQLPIYIVLWVKIKCLKHFGHFIYFFLSFGCNSSIEINIFKVRRKSVQKKNDIHNDITCDKA